MKTVIAGVILVLMGVGGLNDGEFFGLLPLIIGIFLIWLKTSDGSDKSQSFKLAEIDTMTGLQFEHYVASLLKERGMQVEVTPATGDYGADVIATGGETKYAVQAKRYKVDNSVSVHAVMEAVAAMPFYGCNKALVITSSYFTRSAINYANRSGCELVDRDKLHEWIREVERNLATKQIDLSEVVSENEANLNLKSWFPRDNRGYVINTGRPPRSTNTKVHSVNCGYLGDGSLAPPTTRYKILAPSLKTVEVWGQNHLGESPSKCKKCLRKKKRS